MELLTISNFKIGSILMVKTIGGVDFLYRTPINGNIAWANYDFHQNGGVFTEFDLAHDIKTGVNHNHWYGCPMSTFKLVAEDVKTDKEADELAKAAALKYIEEQSKA